MVDAEEWRERNVRQNRFSVKHVNIKYLKKIKLLFLEKEETTRALRKPLDNLSNIVWPSHTVDVK